MSRHEFGLVAITSTLEAVRFTFRKEIAQLAKIIAPSPHHCPRWKLRDGKSLNAERRMPQKRLLRPFAGCNYLPRALRTYTKFSPYLDEG